MAVEMCFVMYDSHVTDVDVLFLFIFLLMIHEGVRRNTLSLCTVFRAGGSSRCIACI